MRKRLISLLLVLTMVISLGGVLSAFADNETTGETVEVTDETGESGDTTGDSDTVEDGDEVTEGGSAAGDGDTTEDNDDAGDEDAAEDDDEKSDGSDSEDTDNSQDDSADAEETVGSDMSVASGVTETVQDTAVEEVSDETEEEDTGVAATQSCEGSDYTVTVSYEAEAGIPEDAVLTVEEYATDSSAYQTYYEQIAEIYGWEEDNTENVRVFDIGLYAGGEEIEPDATVQVTITFAEQEDSSG
ncbi:MAG: hypothetical protein LUF68_07115, partial [Clostridiales bacterium]|nr:hypothetical protein [Clostridiales bacterium]